MVDVNQLTEDYRLLFAERYTAAVQGFEDTFRETLPVGETGQLRDTFMVVVDDTTSDVFSATADLPVPYATWLDEGTSPYDIFPLEPGGTLAFQVGGQLVFAKSVHHPGISPQQIWAEPAPIYWRIALEDAFS